MLITTVQENPPHYTRLDVKLWDTRERCLIAEGSCGYGKIEALLGTWRKEKGLLEPVYRLSPGGFKKWAEVAP
jgi:hypothetical protein